MYDFILIWSRKKINTKWIQINTKRVRNALPTLFVLNIVLIWQKEGPPQKK